MKIVDSFPDVGKNVIYDEIDEKTNMSHERKIALEEFKLKERIILLKEKYNINEDDISVLNNLIDDFGARKYSEGTFFDFDLS